VLDAASTAANLWFDEFELQPLGSGHIHDTRLVAAQGERFVLQCVNEFVFQDGDLVMRQTERLLAHLGSAYQFTIPRLHLSRKGQSSERLHGRLWRVWRYVENTTVVDPIRTTAQAHAAGQAFATLQQQLADLAPRLQETIPGFLQLGHYLTQFDEVEALAPGPLKRIVSQHRHLADQFVDRNAHIHGDCKINNLLFDDTGSHVAAIIDFDTAMYGHWAWDFGDLVRSMFFSRGGVDLDLYRASLSGFLEGCKPNDSRATQFVMAPQYVAFMLGVRFLTDHLCEDVYFKVKKHGENLQRANEQFALQDDMVSHQAAINTIVEEEIRRSRHLVDDRPT
jgi:hypothetical protein